ncbi:permease [Paenibacillus crassostreae]|uniref:Permease n=1 Tax=Paenibacillus crassostreae TaxID=1763538 RepID=A0A167FTE2_9BACL|nr:permease [Paenibacillus crassostreae]AOZ94084.1 permease [Paenibacillus crassostreae]OAB76880.1 permease [Paenibacillus crassostreae]
MFAGHFGIAAIVKAKYQEVPTWALLISTQLLDILFVPLYISGIETMEPVGSGTGYGETIIHANYTHSLVGALLIAIIAGLLAGWSWGKRIGYIIGGIVFSHWILDLLVHRSDLPILPGNLGNFALLGFGLWKSPVISAGLESILVVLGTFLYARSALIRAKTTTGNHSRETNKSRAMVASVVMGVFLILSLLSNWI